MSKWKVTYSASEPVTIEVEAESHAKAVRAAMEGKDESFACISATEIVEEAVAEELGPRNEAVEKKAKKGKSKGTDVTNSEKPVADDAVSSGPNVAD